MTRFFSLVLCSAAVSATPLAAQHSYSESGNTYDPRVPSPRSVLGYEIGDRFTPHRTVLRYIERLAATSKRIRVDTVARSFEGREMLLVTIASESNLARVDELRRNAQRLGDPRGLSPNDVAALVRQSPSTVWLAQSVHGGEASGVEAGLAILYQLAAGTDPTTQQILDSTIVLMDPVENPDGRERHTHDIERMWSAQSLPSEPGALNNAGSWPGARTSHYGFDLNRDWFILSHPESRGRVASFLSWMPHVAIDAHEQGSSATFYFAPPREPDNKNNPKHLNKWFDIFAAAHGAAFDKHGWSYFRREGYDSFYPGYGEGWPMLTGSIGMLFEAASSSGGGVRRNDGFIRTLRQAAWEHYTAEFATLRTAAARRTELVSDYVKSRQDAIAIHSAGPIRAVIYARDAQGRADTLTAKLKANGIEVQRLTSDTELRGATPFGETSPALVARLKAGDYVVDLAQPQGHLAKAILEPDAELDSAFVKVELELRRTGQGDRFYDVTAWSLPFAFRLNAWHSKTMPTGLQPAELPRAAVMPNGNAQYGYAFEPGSEASNRLLARLLVDSIHVWHAPRWFISGGRRFAQGAFVVRVAANAPNVHERVRSAAAAAGAALYAVPSAGVEAGTDLGSNSVRPIPFPRVAVLSGAPISGGSWGFAWFALDQRLALPTTLIDAAFVPSGLDNFSTVVIPSVNGAALDRALGDGGKARLVDWVRNGGVLITIDGSSAWLAQESTRLSRLRVRRDTTRADSAGGAPLQTDLPGVIARATTDSLSPLLAGIAEREIPVFANSDRVFTVPKDLAAGEAVIRFAPKERVRLGGYFWPEMSERIALSPWAWTERVGRGRVIAFAHDLNFRDLFRGLLPIFENAVLLGGTF